MKRLCCSIALVITVAVGVSVTAQENLPAGDREPQAQGSWRAELSVVYAMSRLGRYVSTDPVAIWSRAWYRLGVGSRIMIGTSQFDVHGAPFVRLGAGPVSLDAGWVVELIDRTSAFQLVDNGPFGVLAFQVPALELGLGHFAITFGIEVFFPLWPDEDQPSLAGADLVPTGWNDPTIADLARNIGGRTMAHLGLLYTFPF
jgi:hypothetical protein